MSAKSDEGEHEDAPVQTEEKTKECDSGGELGDMGVVAGGGAESQDQEVRAQRGRRELGEEERRHRRGTCVSCCRREKLFSRWLQKSNDVSKT